MISVSQKKVFITEINDAQGPIVGPETLYRQAAVVYSSNTGTRYRMTALGQSLREAQRPIGSVVSPKHHIYIGAWNVRTMYAAGAASVVANERERYTIDIYLA